MRVISLQSGSNGNALFVESMGTSLLFDAGISGAQLQARLAEHGYTPENIDALFISHDHSDHVRCAGVYTRKFSMPIYVTYPTIKRARRRMALGELAEIHHFRSGAAVKVGALTVETLGTPHDAADGVVFVVDDGISRLGICTDLGHVFSDLGSLVNGVDALFLESNYDEKMLADSSYPAAIKRRIHGPGGHISNLDAAELVASHASSRLQWLCLAHLSEESNFPDLALSTHRRVLGRETTIHIASRYETCGPLTIGTPRSGPPRLYQPSLF